MLYTFEPTDFATRFFNLSAKKYTGQGMTPLLEEVLGKENCNQYLVAQDPLAGGRTSGIVSVCLNRSEWRDPSKLRFEAIGIITQLG